MRQLILIVLAAAACTPQLKRPTTPTEYACNGYSFTHQGSEVKLGDSNVVGGLAARDSAGEHYVAEPTSARGHALELVVPEDPRRDAQARTYDTTLGSSPADWRLTDTRVCTARGGYTDILARYVKGESLDELRTSLALGDRDDARALLRHAFRELARRYYHER